MRATAILLVATLLTTVALAGCMGGEDGEEREDLERTARVTNQAGGIQGVVTDSAIQPLSAVNVTISETNETTQTAGDGSFAFDQVAPGSYTVVVRDPGFVSSQQTVQVQAGEVAIVDFILEHLQSEQPFTQQLELAGFFECGFEVGWNVTEDVPGGYFFLGLAACATGSDVNATNDKFSHFFDLDPPLDTLVHEMTWQADDQFSEWMTVSMNVQGTDANADRFMRKQGPSPITTRFDRPHWEELSANFTERCENGEDAYCGFNFFDQGWPLQTRVFPAWQCQSESAGACVVLQQEFTHFVSAFYHAPAPEGYSLVDGQG